ncbi:MAG TPA: anti-sigma regulatory factor [bacterium]|jgi:anti-sigma regulatory factor (Ser/Thr protein kinase)
MTATRPEIFERSYTVRGNDYENAGEVATSVKNILRQVKLDPEFVRRVTIALFEAEMNAVIHAYDAEIFFLLAPEKIEIVIKDRGPGIHDIELAMQEGYTTASEEAKRRGFGAGMGLANIKKNADTLKIESEVDVGTTVFIGFELANI